MQRFRDPLRHHPAIIAGLLALALLLKLLVPSGYMLETTGASFGLVPCSGMAPTHVMPPAVAMPGMTHHADHDGNKDKPAAEHPCAFAGLSGVTLAAADPLLLALAIAFVIAAGIRPIRLRPAKAHAHLRPPLRGPPLRL